MNGIMHRMKIRSKALGLLLFSFALLPLMTQTLEAQTQDQKSGDDAIYERLDRTRLAYVLTGEAEVDNISDLGLRGLSEFIRYRTSFDPSDPIGIDIENDELAFYPIIYWPISATAEMPSNDAIARIDSYMRSGGTVLFDTRDQLSTDSALGSTTANGSRLQDILASIDIPPLEATPSNHVLTRTFFLLDNFPGRFNGSPLWIEALRSTNRSNSSITAAGDGVTPIMITANDFAGAWAVGENGEAVLQTVPPDPKQREYAFRTGLNIMMYMLTGNYKADQVHVPALLERLGQ